MPESKPTIAYSTLRRGDYVWLANDPIRYQVQVCYDGDPYILILYPMGEGSTENAIKGMMITRDQIVRAKRIKGVKPMIDKGGPAY